MPVDKSLARRTTQKALDIDAAKARVLELVREGYLITPAMAEVGRKFATYRDWRREDPIFKKSIDYLREVAARGVDGTGTFEPVPDFPEFCGQYIGQPLGEHMLRIWDVINDRPPRSLHPAMVFRKGWPERLIINIPPGHAKSTTWTQNYVVWRIHKDPNVKVIVVSKSQGMAKKFLGGIKLRLTSPLYRRMHLAFAPNGGWRDPDGSWTATEIYVQGKGDGEKDPTVQALGLRGHIYGARADLIVLDDIVALDNAGDTEKQLDWISQEVISRLPEDEAGMLLSIGTRVAASDLYKSLRDDYTDYEGNPVFTYFSQPAVLDYADHPKDWATLWPSTQAADGSPKRKWDGPALAKRRAEMRDDRRWALVYQQADVADDATFPPEAVEASINGRRNPGPLKGDTAWGHRTTMDQCYVVGGLDPATTGYTAALIYAVDRRTRKRYVLDGYNKRNTVPSELRSMIKSFTEEYGVKEWRIETNAYQRSIVQDEELKQWLYARGCVVKGHYTTSNKYDEDFGVASMSPLFLSCVTGDPMNGHHWTRVPEGGLIELPNKRLSQVISQLCEQLVVWQPSQRNLIQDLVMALWFCEIAAREHLGVEGARKITHLQNQFMSVRARKGQLTINLNQLEDDQAREAPLTAA